jgi:hypothetical protein
MATNGFQGFYTETRNYTATAEFWASMGSTAVFETGHHSGPWLHSTDGPHVFINQQNENREPETHPILGVADSIMFAPEPVPETVQPFTPRHWAVTEAIIADPDGRNVSLQAPLPPGEQGIHAATHHDEKYGG